MEMRKAYVAAMAEVMKNNPKVVVLDADLASAGGTKPLYTQFPERAIEVGIAEDNMTCVATGLAAYGFIPFIHSFAPFSVRRNFDQIAVSVSYSCQNVKIIGYDPGVTATTNGGTHMCFEDVAMLRALPNIRVMDIVDPVQLAKAVPFVAEHQGPVYMRFARKQTDTLFDEDYKFRPEKADVVRKGNDVTVVASGAMVFDALKGAEILHEKGIEAEVIAVHTVKPLDEQTIAESAARTGCVLVVENHSVHGGLFGAVTEMFARTVPTPCDAEAVYDRIGQVGRLSELKKDYNLTDEDVADKAVKLIARK